MDKKQKIVAAILASLTGFSAVAITGTIIAYDACFPRYERPDYALYPGLYCYDRVKDSLYREEFKFPSKDIELQGYYYPNDHAKALIVLAHGFHAGADNYIPIIQYFVENGYAVFTYDVRATYSSGGDSQVGMCQSLVDIDNALKFVKSDARFSALPICLIGHSWGGYAVSSALALHADVKACACIAPMHSGYDIMVEKAEEYVGKLSAMPKPIFNVYQKILFGDYVNYNGVIGINSTTAPVIVAQGIDDKIITYEQQSIIAHRDEITNPNVIYYETYGLQGDHNNIWHSNESAAYQMEIASKLRALEIKKGGELTYEEKCEFYSTVDHKLYSEVNPELMSLILSVFDKAVK